MSRQELIGKYLAVSAHIGGGPRYLKIVVMEVVTLPEGKLVGALMQLMVVAGVVATAVITAREIERGSSSKPKGRHRRAAEEASFAKRGSTGNFLDDDDDGAFHVLPISSRRP